MSANVELVRRAYDRGTESMGGCARYCGAVSRENVEIVQRGFEAWERGDLETHLRLFHENVVCCRVAPLIDARTYEGLEGYLQFAAEWLDPYDEVTFRPAEYVDAGDKVLVEVPQEGRLAGSDQVMKGLFWFLFTLRDGRVSRFEIYGERNQALEAAAAQ